MSIRALCGDGSHPYPGAESKNRGVPSRPACADRRYFRRVHRAGGAGRFCKLFGELDAPLGKYYVLGNHDLFHHWREPSFGRADLERGFAAAGVRILEDTSVLLPCGVRVVGRKDYLYTNGSRFTAAQLMPGGPDDHYTVWLDHEPRDFKNAAAAGADLILSGHTHGGQVWPAGAVGMVAKNERNYGRKNIADHCDAIVSGGTGTWGYKFRTQGRTEIVCAEITTEREN